MNETTNHNELDDTEGHGRWSGLADAGQDDTEGHAIKGHVQPVGADDTEGHGRWSGLADAGQDDTEGHAIKGHVQPLGTDNTEGHGTLRGSVSDAGEDDVAGHLRMTSEQLRSGMTPSELAAEARRESKHREPRR